MMSMWKNGGKLPAKSATHGADDVKTESFVMETVRVVS